MLSGTSRHNTIQPPFKRNLKVSHLLDLLPWQHHLYFCNFSGRNVFFRCFFEIARSYINGEVMKGNQFIQHSSSYVISVLFWHKNKYRGFNIRQSLKRFHRVNTTLTDDNQRDLNMVCNNSSSIPCVTALDTPSGLHDNFTWFLTVDCWKYQESHGYQAWDGSPCIKTANRHNTTTVYLCCNIFRIWLHSLLATKYINTASLNGNNTPAFFKIHVFNLGEHNCLLFLICKKVNDAFNHYCFVEAMTLLPSAQWKCFIF